MGIGAERFEETRKEREPVGFVFPVGTGVEVWRPEDGSDSPFGAGNALGFRLDYVEAARARTEAAGVGFPDPVQSP